MVHSTSLDPAAHANELELINSTPENPMPAQLVIIGGGNMAQAIAFGALEAGLTMPARLAVCEPDAAKRGLFEQHDIYATPSHDRALGLLAPGVGQVLLAVKPQMLDDMAAQVRGLVPPGTTVITILAGTTSERVRVALGGSVRVVRAMPNTAARVRKSITAVCAGAGASRTECALAEQLFSGLGEVVFIDEALMDAFTALAGSGPAYVFYLAEAMVKAAIATGFDASIADGVVRQTILGAAALLMHDRAVTPEHLRAAVTSKGGTTEAAVKVLDGWGDWGGSTGPSVMQAFVAAIIAGRDRAREIG